MFQHRHIDYHHVFYPHLTDLPAQIFGTESSVTFSDSEQLALDDFATMVRTTWFYDGKRILGLAAQYRTAQGELLETVHRTESDKETIEIALELEQGEYVTHVSGRAGDGIENLEVGTNKGKRISIGRTGELNFQVSIPKGYTVQSFSGSLATGLSSLSAVLKPVSLWHSVKCVFTFNGQRIEHGNDSEAPIKGLVSSAITSVHVKSDSDRIYSLKVNYQGMAGRTQIQEELDGVAGKKSIQDSLELRDGEFISLVQGIIEDGKLTSFRIGTNSGRSRLWGRETTSPTFFYTVKSGERVTALQGIMTAGDLCGVEVYTTYRYPLP